MLQLCLTIIVTSVVASQNPRQSLSHPPPPLQQRPETPTDSECPSFPDFGDLPPSPTESLGSVTPYLRVFHRTASQQSQPPLMQLRIPSQQNTQRTAATAAGTANPHQSRQFPMGNRQYTTSVASYQPWQYLMHPMYLNQYYPSFPPHLHFIPPPPPPRMHPNPVSFYPLRTNQQLAGARNQYRKLLIKQFALKYHCEIKLPSDYPILDCHDPSSKITSNSLLECDWTMQTNGFKLYKIIFTKQKIKHLNEQMFPSNEYQLSVLWLLYGELETVDLTHATYLPMYLKSKQNQIYKFIAPHSQQQVMEIALINYKYTDFKLSDMIIPNVNRLILNRMISGIINHESSKHVFSKVTNYLDLRENKITELYSNDLPKTTLLCHNQRLSVFKSQNHFVFLDLRFTNITNKTFNQSAFPSQTRIDL